MRYLLIVLGLFVSFFGNAQSQGITNAQTKLRPNQLRWSPTDATLDSVYIIRADTATGEPGWYLVTLGGSGVADTKLSGDVVGGLNSTFVRKINGVTVENKTPQNREVLTYNGTQWTPDSIDLEDLPQMNASRLLGRGSTTNGAPEQITAGTGLRISTNILETYMQGGTGITLSGSGPMTITNSLPDQTVSIAGGGINSVTGTYPNFTVTGTEVDGSTTNEIQTIDTLTVASNLLRLKLSGSAVKTLAMSNFATTPAGSSMQVQYNNAGAFGALDSFTVSANPDRLGIGVPTPTARLDIQGSGSTSATNALMVRNSSGTNLLTIRGDGLISSGSITTPSSPKSGQFETEGSILSGAYSSLGNVNGGYGMVGSNYYVNSSNVLVRKKNDVVSMLEFSDGFQFQTSGSGVEGSSIARTTRAKITAGGYVGLNIATPLAGIHNAINTTTNTPSMLLSGTGFSGGTATTTKPTLLIEPTGTTSTGWSTSGTKFGVNAESGFTGRFLDIQLSGVSKFNVQSDKINLSTSKTPSSASDTGTAGDICWDSNYIYVCIATNTWKRTAITTW